MRGPGAWSFSTAVLGARAGEDVTLTQFHPYYWEAPPCGKRLADPHFSLGVGRDMERSDSFPYANVQLREDSMDIMLSGEGRGTGQAACAGAGLPAIQSHHAPATSIGPAREF